MPIGFQCATGLFKREFTNEASLPFDWMFATPKFVYEMLELLLEQNLDIRELVENHFFNCQKKVVRKRDETFFVSRYGSILYNEKYVAIFPHDKDINESKEKYIRRFERLKNLILNSSETLYFVYSSQSSLQKGNLRINHKEVVVDSYYYLDKIYNLICKYRNGLNFRTIVFDTINKDDPSLLNENITLCRLNSCNTWRLVLEQMRKQINLFSTP